MSGTEWLLGRESISKMIDHEKLCCKLMRYYFLSISTPSPVIFVYWYLKEKGVPWSTATGSKLEILNSSYCLPLPPVDTLIGKPGASVVRPETTRHCQINSREIFYKNFLSYIIQSISNCDLILTIWNIWDEYFVLQDKTSL